MAEKKQPPQGGTPVAQDDLLGEAARATGPVEGPDAQPRDDMKDSVRGHDRGNAQGDAAPGRDENQAGFVKDRDKTSQP